MKLEVEGITKKFNDQTIFEDLSFQVSEGEFVSILGPSGCGKSTILNIISGSLSKNQGKVVVDSQEVPAFSSHFAYMPQTDLLFEWYTILQNVCLPASLNKKNVEKEAISLMKDFGLAGYENHYPSSLSGGMRQRAAFLRTIFCEADILLLDEPFGALDLITREEMQDWLLSMKNKLNKTIILVTHDIDEAIYLSDRILILSNQPTTINEELLIKPSKRNREWLYQESELRLYVHQKLRVK